MLRLDSPKRSNVSCAVSITTRFLDTWQRSGCATMTDSLRPLRKCTTQDRARRSLVKLRGLCNELTNRGLRHEEIAALISTSPRTLSSWKGGVTVPHWAVDALESAVMKVAKKVSGT